MQPAPISASVIQIFLVAVLGLVVLELLFRFFGWFNRTFLVDEVSRKDFLSKEYHSYLARVEDWSKPMFYYLPVGLRLFNLANPIPEKVENNSLGYRCPEFNLPGEGTYRIAFLGGSAAWGAGSSSNATTISGWLENMMNKPENLPAGYHKVECFNLGQINGYQTQDVLSLSLYGNRIKPNLVISFTGWNELIASHGMKRDILEKFGLFYIEEMESWEPVNVTGNKTRQLKESASIWLKEYSELARRVGRLLPAKRDNRADESLDDLVDVRTGLFLNHLEIINTLSGSFNAPHLQFLQPYLYRKPNLSETEERVVYMYDEVRPVHGEKMGDYLRNVSIYDPIIDKASSDPDRYGAIHNLSEIYKEERETKFYTLVHMNDDGYFDIAREIHKRIKEMES